ncbi:liprin-beta-1 isoform X1 [Hylaeus volcanicus]|uniref:liprin-beta-1 isoform X1 n=2 Tax=Hylaeus volcanicus TaxID=313075 RepID=UPI0023B81908|nr:liprin-beta-1 isoform X1 [Hylaeus volcanicus]XP_053970842.1 liprin-beta-1 isoform X1 [Hylaeus volcanicus]XP_053970843.1 liprin-beta-1 isoform X1 [Hylaeus volcanicus]
MIPREVNKFGGTSDSLEAMPRIKQWDDTWNGMVHSEDYYSSGTSNSEQEEDEFSCPLGYGKLPAFRGSEPNLCATINLTHIGNHLHCCSAVHNMRVCSEEHSYQGNAKEYRGKRGNQSYESGKERQFRNRINYEQKARSQTDLFLRRRESPYCCSLQHFHDTQNWNEYQTPSEERLRKSENERGALRMEVSVLSEQVDAQSTKIQELESLLREKKDSLRRMEEALQKEVLSRSALETQKLELLSSLSEMKLRLTNLEHENLALRSANLMSNEEQFERHTSQYSSLPRPPSSSKKGVAFGKVSSLASGTHTTVPLAIRGVSARCLSAPTLAEEEKTIIIGDPNSRLETQKPLAELSMEEIEDWLANLGLECYAGELRRWGATGAKLLECSQQQLERELEIKNILHRKKLLYAIESEKYGGSEFFGSDKMDNAAVLRWLDDIGLPQHKEAFQIGKVDGRMLHRLTTEDLLNLGVTAQLHAASLRRGIQVLRELNFEFDNLERRSANGNGADGSNVRLWTNHRVMEWLRVVDLAEYAPNMRGSGLHGGLMMYEGRFTSELLATLLSISPGKTLLRRHLTTHFNQILGREVVQRKREIESTLGFIPLTLTARLKVPKKSQFTLKRKKSKNEADYGNLVCPLESSPPGTPSTPTSTPGSPNLNSPTF